VKQIDVPNFVPEVSAELMRLNAMQRPVGFFKGFWFDHFNQVAREKRLVEYLDQIVNLDVALHAACKGEFARGHTGLATSGFDRGRLCAQLRQQGGIHTGLARETVWSAYVAFRDFWIEEYYAGVLFKEISTFTK